MNEIIEQGLKESLDIIQVQVSASLKGRLRAAAQKTDTSMTTIIRAAIEQYVDQRGHTAVIGRPEPVADRVLDVLWAHARPRVLNDVTDMIAPMTIEEIAQDLGVTSVTALRRLRELEAQGEVHREQRKGWGARRTIVLRSDPAPTTTPTDDGVFGTVAMVERVRPGRRKCINAASTAAKK
jgi:CRP-like cAMP-binding protein